jgi:hypothetical protein
LRLLVLAFAFALITSHLALDHYFAFNFAFAKYSYFVFSYTILSISIFFYGFTNLNMLLEFVILYCVGSDFFNFLLGLFAFAQQLIFDVGGAESAYMFTTSVFLGVKSLGCDSLNSLSAVDLANDDEGTPILKIKQEIKMLENNLNISNIDSEQFQEFANGIFQAEGTIGAYFSSKESLRVEFNFSMGQNYSKEAVNFLLKLKAFLGVGRIAVEKNTVGIIHIRLVTTKTQDDPHSGVVLGQSSTLL